jgi:hypothetical protein
MTLLPVQGSGTADLLAGEYVAATVEGDVDMVAVVNEETTYNFPQLNLHQKAVYSAISDKAKTNRVGVPTYKEEWIGRIMGATVQNVGPVTTTVTATIQNVNVETWAGAIPPTADLHIQRRDLGPGASTTFLLLSRDQAQLYQDVEVVSGDPYEFARTNNSMTIESSQPLAVIVNQENTYLPENPPPVLLDAASYEGIPLASD